MDDFRKTYFRWYMKRTIIFLTAICLLGLSGHTPYEGNKMNFDAHEWQKEWDFHARNLSLEQGTPSKLGFVVQPRINRLDVFGSVGKFPSQSGGFVGFVQLTTKMSLPDATSTVSITGSSQTPDVTYRFILMTDAHDNGSYQANFRFNASSEKAVLQAEDFRFYIRGRLVEDQEPVNFSRVKRVGFLVTRSSQDDQDQPRIPFEFEVDNLTFE